jgi:hypothetical protein
MKHADAFAMAEDALNTLKPHCERICIAGSIRRQRVVLKNSAALIAGLLPAWCILGDAILSGSPGIPVVTRQISLPRRAKPLEIFGRPLNDVLFSREFRESLLSCLHI